MALFFTVFELAVELVQPIIMAVMIDEGVVKGNLSVIYGWGGLLLGLSLLAFAGGIINTFYSAKVSQGVGYEIRKELFTRIQSFSFKHFQSLPTSSLITRLTNDVTQIQTFIFMGLRIALRAPLFILGGIIMAYSVHVGLAHILLVAVPILLLITLWLLKKGVFYFQLVQKKLDAVNRVIRENLMGIRLIKAYTRGRYEEKRFTDVNDSLMKDNKKALWIMELTMPLLMLGMNVSMVVILWFGSIYLNLGSAQAGEVVAIINYATRIMFSFGVFSFLMMNYSRAKASSARITEVLDVGIEQHLLEKRPDGGDLRVEGELEFVDVSFQYSSEKKPVLENLNFFIKPGETVGILGETGSGKTSLFQLIPRLYEVTKGEIFLDGEEIRTIPLQMLRKQIGLVPQEAHLFSGTIKENIGWGKNDASLEEIIQAAKDAEIHDFIKSLPDGYDTRVGQRGVNLSGGQKQRLSIARALVRNPSILLLDDSTSALDARTEKRILTRLKRQACTTLIIAQKISSVKGADHILLLHDGEIIGDGTHEFLLKENSYYQRIYWSQSKEEAGHVV
nr:ABC transporter ATP-binding protein [Bacillus dakarensis]